MQIIDLLLLILFILVPVFAVKLCNYSGIRILNVSIPSLFMLNYLLTAYAGILPLYLHWDNQSVRYDVVDPDTIVTLFFYSSFSILLVCGTFFLSSQSKALRINNNAHDAIIISLNERSVRITACILFFCCCVIALYIYSLPGVPLFAALQGEPKRALFLRMTAEPSFGKSQYFKVFTVSILYFVCMLTYADALCRRTKGRWAVAFVAFLAALFSFSLETSKAGSMFVIFGYGLTYLLVLNKRIKLKYFLLFAVFVLILGAYLSVVYYGTSSVNYFALVESVLSRITTGNMDPAYHLIDLFKREPFLMGRSFPNPMGIFPYTQIEIDRVIWDKIFVGEAFQAYTAPSVYWAEMYANFGFVGVIFGAVFVGLFLYVMQRIINKMKNNPVKIALIVWMAIHYMSLAQKGLFKIMWDYDMVAVVLVAMLISYVERKKHYLYTEQV